MAISILGTEVKTANGTITIPDTCTRIFALVKGSISSPIIDGAAMEEIVSVPATSYTEAVSIHRFTVSEDNVSVSFSFEGTKVTFFYLVNASGYRPGTVYGQGTASISGDLPTTTSDLVLGILAGQIGPTSLKGDTVAFTNIVSDTLCKIGHITPGDTTLTCLAEDTGVSSGYWIDGGSRTHPAELITAGYYSFDPVWHAGYYEWELQYVNGVETWVNVWHPAYYTYEPTWHPPVYSEEWEEELPDTWVPGGDPAKVAACFVSVQETASGQFVPQPIFYKVG